MAVAAPSDSVARAWREAVTALASFAIRKVLGKELPQRFVVDRFPVWRIVAPIAISKWVIGQLDQKLSEFVGCGDSMRIEDQAHRLRVLEPGDADAVVRLVRGRYKFRAYGNSLVLMLSGVGQWPEIEEALETDLAVARAEQVEATVARMGVRPFLGDIGVAREALSSAVKANLAAEIGEIGRTVVGGSIVAISGPSASGKSTIAALLVAELKERGLSPLILELDRFYRPDSELEPLFRPGRIDYDCVEAFALEDLRDDLEQIMQGKAVPKRAYDYKTGVVSREEGEPWRIPDRERAVVIVEGIMALHPKLLSRIGERPVCRVYVDCVSVMKFDEGHAFRSEDLRLMRRLVRDVKERERPVVETFQRWPGVVASEEKHILLQRREAQFMLTLDDPWEIQVLAASARPLLEKSEGASDDVAAAMRRLLEILRHVPAAPEPASGV